MRGRYGGHAEPPPSGAPHRDSRELGTESGVVCLPNVYPASISWDTYLANGARLRANRARWDTGSAGMPRKGKPLLQGLVWCNCCGRQMAVRYSGSRGQYTSYRCGMDAKEYGGPYCQEVRGLGLNAAVEQLVLAALAPERLVLALDALDQREREVDALEHQWQLRLERVRYEAQRAQRQYDEVDPANRLVARVLESQWEAKLRLVEQTQRDYDTWKKANHMELTAQERAEIVAIGEDLPRVWHAETTTSADRKHLLRLVVKAVSVDQKRQPGKVRFEITWQSGARTVHEIDRLGVRYQDVSGSERLKHRLCQLPAQRQSDAQGAQVLNAEGYRTAKGRPFRGKNVWYLRRLWGLSSEQTGEMTADGLRWSDKRYTVRGVAQAVGVSNSTVHRWLQQGRLKGEYLGTRQLWRIQLTTRQMNRLRKEGSATPGPSTAETITVN